MRAFVALPLIALATLAYSTLALLVGLVDRGAARRLARTWARTSLALGGVRVECLGQPLDGPAVYAVNHVSVLDIPILFAHLPADFRIVHKRSLHWLPLVGWYLALAGHLAIDRRNPFRARRSLARAAERIHDGVSVAVFPEGTRRGRQGLGVFKRGTFVLAINAGVPVVPVALVGLERLVPRGLLSLRPGTARLMLHAPVLTTGRGPEQAETLAAEVREIVARSLQLAV